MTTQTNSSTLVSGMKKRVVLMAAGLTVATVLVFTSLASPGAGVASANSGALVIDGRSCGLLDGDGYIVRSSASHIVITENANGNRVLKCSVKGVANSTGKAAHFGFENTGYRCYAMGVSTTNWHNKVSKSGNATLTCLVP